MSDNERRSAILISADEGFYCNSMDSVVRSIIQKRISKQNSKSYGIGLNWQQSLKKWAELYTCILDKSMHLCRKVNFRFEIRSFIAAYSNNEPSAENNLTY